MSIIKHHLHDCQVELYNDTQTFYNIYDLNRKFLGDCSDFVKNINDLENSPWKNDGIVRWAMDDQKIRLGSFEKRILRFLQNKYFTKNQPCFSKQSFIGKILNAKRTQVNRTIKSLENKGLILKIQWLYKGRRKNSIILPLIPSIKSLFKDENLPTTDFQKCYMQCNKLFCKPPKSKKFSKPFLLYTNILYINKLFNFNMVTINSLLAENKMSFRHIVVSDETTNVGSENSLSNEEPLDSKKSDLKGACILDKFLLKPKKHVVGNSRTDPIEKRLKTRSINYEFEKLSHEDQIKYNEYVSYFFGIDLKGHFKYSPSKSHPVYIKYTKDLRKRFIQLIANGHELEWKYSDKIIEQWNNHQIPDKRLQKINLGKMDSKAYKNAVIAISHCLIYKCKSNLNLIPKAINRLEKSHSFRKYPFTLKNKISIDMFFMNSNEGEYLSAYLGSDIEFDRYLFEFKPNKRLRNRIELGYERFIDIYCDFFDNKKKAKDNCYHFEGMIKKWLQERIIDIVDTRGLKKWNGRQMYSYSLIESKHDGIETIPPLLHLYFNYLRQNNIPFTFVKICDLQTWNGFIKDHMRSELGMYDFYKLIPKKKGAIK